MRTTPSLTIHGHAYAVGDTVRFRLSPEDPWRTGHVSALRPREGALQVQPAQGLDRRPVWITQDGGALEPRTPGGSRDLAQTLPRRRRADALLAPLHGPALDAALEGDEELPPAPPPPRPGLQRRTPLKRKIPLRAQHLPVAVDPCFTGSTDSSTLPTLRIVYTGSVLHDVPKPDKPARCPRYLAYVRSQECCACLAPAPSEAHHDGPRGVSQKASDFLTSPLCGRCHQAITATGKLPGRSRAQTRALIHAIQAALLARWAAAREVDAERDADAVAQVPVLRLVAGER